MAALHQGVADVPFVNSPGFFSFNLLICPLTPTCASKGPFRVHISYCDVRPFVHVVTWVVSGLLIGPLKKYCALIGYCHYRRHLLLVLETKRFIVNLSRYGDKAPKFLLARVLSVVWMFMGIAVMAYLTAIMTTALTSGTVKDHKVIVNKKVSCLRHLQLTC